MLGVFFFPRRGLHFSKGATHHHLNLVTAHASGCATAIHRSITTAQNDYALADRINMFKGNTRQPINTNVDIGRGLLPTGDIEIAATGGAAADKHRVIVFI